MSLAKKSKSRTKEFLEAAFIRARKVLNPRDFAIIFQAARSSAGGQISARNRRDRMLLVDKSSLKGMSKAELMAVSASLDKTYKQAHKAGGNTGKLLSRAGSLREEFRRRGMDEPSGLVYVELKKRGKKDVRKGFVSGQSEGGMHAHGLDRRNGKTFDDGGHRHIWLVPVTGEFVASDEDGFHQHAFAGDMTDPVSGPHSHRVILSSGALVETKLDGGHAHELMVETSGFGGLHTHMLVMPDGTELQSLSITEVVDDMVDGAIVSSGSLPFASEIVNAMHELREEREENEVGGELPEIDEAVEMVAMGKTLVPPVFTVEVSDPGLYPGLDASVGDLMDVRHDGEVIGFSRHMIEDDPKDVKESCDKWDLITKHTTKIPFVGPKDARMMFVCTAPNQLELARKSALVGDDAVTFERIYLDPLGLKKSDVAIGFAMPVFPHGDLTTESCEIWSSHLVEAMKSYSSAKVVAIGRVARQVLSGAGVEHWSLPHPFAVRKRGDSGEVGRKLKAIAKALDVRLPAVQDQGKNVNRAPSDGSAARNLADTISETRKTGHTNCRVIKSADEKQIVYGVVLDPYVVDLQADWVPPAEIESTAHGFLEKSRVIGFEHLERADARIVESWVEVYPSREDYLLAMDNLPHSAYTRKFGDDVVRSGTWVAGVKLGDKEWELHKQGKLNAFSVGGFSFKSKVTTAAMPDVKFTELVGLPV